MKKILYKEAQVVRSFIERNSIEIQRLGYPVFDSFPNGCCEYASFFLARHLVNIDLFPISELMVPYNTWHPSLSGHGWLRIANTWDVDITADQFGAKFNKVIVSKVDDGHLGHRDGEWEDFETVSNRCTWRRNQDDVALLYELIENLASKSK